MDLDIYHDHFLCILALMSVFFLDLAFHHPNSPCKSQSVFVFLNFFSLLVMVAMLFLKVHFLDSFFSAASCLSRHFLFVHCVF